MKNNKTLAALVIILTVGLVAQSVYLWKIKSDYEKSIQESQLITQKSFDVARNRAAGFDPFAFGSMLDHYDPFYEMERIQQRMNRMFRDSFSRAMDLSGPAFFSQHTFFEPEIDINESGTHYVVKLDLPGMEKDQINVEVKDHFLVVSGNRKIEKEETDEDGKFYRAERSFGSFSRAVPLPADANQDDIQAEYKNGVLAVKIAKLAPAEGDKKTDSKVEIK